MPELDPTEDNSANNWVSALENNEGHIDESELVWYDSETPVYHGNPTPAQVEAARRFVSQWLNTDAKGFVIPGSEWGRSLKHWLHILVAQPAPETTQEPED